MKTSCNHHRTIMHPTPSRVRLLRAVPQTKSVLSMTMCLSKGGQRLTVSPVALNHVSWALGGGGNMVCRRQQSSRWVVNISAVSVLLGLLIAPQLCARAAAETLVTTDYWVSHTSSEPFYRQYKLEPQVVLHV